MPFEIVRNDITKMAVDAIVNTANPMPMIGAGTDAMIHEAAGPKLLVARQKIGKIDVGCAEITSAFDLQAKYVIHTVGPVWNGGGDGEEEMLRKCYDNALKLAVKKNCKSIAFPLISSGNYEFPKDKALRVAIAAFSAFLLEYEMQIYLVVFHREAYQLSEKLFSHVKSYIDQNYVDARENFHSKANENLRYGSSRRIEKAMEMDEVCACAPMAASKAFSPKDMFRDLDAGFTETLLKLIDKSGKKDSEIYKKANLSKQHFSKIRKNPDYRPTKPTAIALALALELSLEDTKDLIGRAGYALTNSSKFDLIIKYFIQQGNYNVVEINIVLFANDQSLLGA